MTDIDNTLAFELDRADRGNGERNVLNILRAAGGRHDDDIVLESFALLHAVLRDRGRCQGGCAKRGREQFVYSVH